MSSTFEHLDIEFEEINKLGIAEIIALKGEGGVISEQVKQTLLECFRNVAWVDEHGQEYVDALRNALYPPAYLVSISAVYTQSGTIYPTDSLDDLKDDLVVTATYSDGIEVIAPTYALSGELMVGESIITVSYGGKITTFTVEVTRVPNTYDITNNLTGASNSNSATFVTEGDSYSGTITANPNHTLDGATISITMGGVDITSTAYDDGEISIAEVTGDVVITVVAVAIVVVSISAVYTQSGTIYTNDSLDDLRADLIVTATYNDSSTEVVPSTDYTLSGTLTAGTSTIYVVYSGKTTTFNVIVTAGFYYTPSKGLLSAQSYVTASTLSNYFTESIDNGFLKIYSPKSGQSSTQAGIVMFDTKWTTNATITMEFKVTDMVVTSSSNTTTPGTFTLAFTNNETAGSAGYAIGSSGFARYNNATGNVRMRNNTGSGSSWLTNTVSLNTLHTLEIIVENGTQTVKLDGTNIVTSGALYTSTSYFGESGSALRVMRSNQNTTEIYIKSLEVAVV